MKIVYDKLVRDGIPRILEKENKVCSYRVANKEEYPAYLKKKLQEEVAEFIEKPCIEELADIAEVLNALSFTVGTTPGILGTAMRSKSARRGRFSKGYILESVGKDEKKD